MKKNYVEKCFIHKNTEMVRNEKGEWVCPVSGCGFRILNVCGDCKKNPSLCNYCVYGGNGWT
jgi:hypothetical protein